jgi:hypothetical protein
MIDQLAALLISYFAVRTQAPVSEADKARLAVIAQANVEECDEHPIPGWPRKACITLATNTEMWESGLMEKVHSGEQVGPAGERCLFQLHRSVTSIAVARYRITRAEWESTTGTDLEHTRNCARLGMRIMRWHIARCSFRYEDGGWFVMSQLYREYHHPSSTCRARLSPLSERRGVAYQTLLYKIGKMEDAR